MPATQYVTLVTTGGTPIRIATQTGASHPTTGSGELVFANNPTLENPTLNGVTWIGPQVIEGDFTVEGDLSVEEDFLLYGSASGYTILRATAVALGILTVPAATDTLVGRATTDTLTNKTIDGGTNTLTNIMPVSSKTGDYAITSSDSYKDFDNNGAAGSVTFTLPASSPLAVGLAYGFAVMEAQNLVIDAPVGVTIYFGEGLLTTAGGTLTANTVGSYIFIKCRSATEWLAQSVIGSWVPT